MTIKVERSPSQLRGQNTLFKMLELRFVLIVVTMEYIKSQVKFSNESTFLYHQSNENAHIYFRFFHFDVNLLIMMFCSVGIDSIFWYFNKAEKYKVEVILRLFQIYAQTNTNRNT